MHRLVFEIRAHARPQRLEVLEFAQVLRELVVQLGDHARADRLQGDVVLHGRAGQFRDREVGGVVDVERPGLARGQARELLVETRGIGRGADLHDDPFVRLGLLPGLGRRLARQDDERCLRLLARRAGQIGDDRVAGFDAAPFHRLVARGPLA